MSDHKLGVAIVGCGFMGRRHLLGFSALHKAGVLKGEVVALLDINKEVAENNLKLKDQMQALATNLSSLNSVYGGMLSAMGSRA